MSKARCPCCPQSGNAATMVSQEIPSEELVGSVASDIESVADTAPTAAPDIESVAATAPTVAPDIKSDTASVPTAAPDANALPAGLDSLEVLAGHILNPHLHAYHRLFQVFYDNG